ncbi:MAG: 7-cyano-7-deazaguanine synthase [Gemmataceae bacterium]|jgi:7-cyano-7-deazaguanine synthase
MMTHPSLPTPVADSAVLISGGLDSAILAGLWARERIIQPIYVHCGLFWEQEEITHCRLFLEAISSPHVLPLIELHQPANDLYGAHWSLSGTNVPGHDTPDEAVFLPGRNVLLLAKALLLCHLRGIGRLGLAPLGSNPFPDATPLFFQTLSSTVNMAVNGNVSVELPFLDKHKVDVMRLGMGMPLQHTFSCIRPIRGLHCGACNKCAERQAAFASADMPDPTIYANFPGSPPCTA